MKMSRGSPGMLTKCRIELESWHRHAQVAQLLNGRGFIKTPDTRNFQKLYVLKRFYVRLHIIVIPSGCFGPLSTSNVIVPLYKDKKCWAVTESSWDFLSLVAEVTRHKYQFYGVNYWHVKALPHLNKVSAAAGGCFLNVSWSVSLAWSNSPLTPQVLYLRSLSTVDTDKMALLFKDAFWVSLCDATNQYFLILFFFFLP